MTVAKPSGWNVRMDHDCQWQGCGRRVRSPDDPYCDTCTQQIRLHRTQARGLERSGLNEPTSLPHMKKQR